MKKGYIDIETFPNICYTWGLFNVNVGLEQVVTPGTTACWAGKMEGEKGIRFFSLQEHGAKRMIEEAYKFLEEADVIIHYNGRKFDIPILNKEFITHGMTPPEPYHQVDLLETARKRFRFMSNKLDFVSQFLGLQSKLAHKGMKLWAGCMEGDQKDWKKMKQYNIQDVKMLPALYNKLLPWIDNHPNSALYLPESVEVCTNCGSTHIVRKGVEHLSTQSYHRYKCMDCGTNMRGRSTIVDPEKRKTVLTQSKL